jgi:hypothetical protein
MAAASTAAARRSAATAPARRQRPQARSAPRSRAGAARPARRVPSRRPARASHRPLTPAPARLVPLAVGRTAVAVSDLADSGLVHRLTRGRLWIGLLTGLLVGIVSLNVLTLSFNASSSKVGRQADGLKREISALRAKITSKGASDERIATAATKLGLVAPEPGAVRYLRPTPGDAEAAAKRLTSGELGTGSSYVVPIP